MLVSTQEHMLQQLAHDLCREGCVKGPILQIAPMETNEDIYVKGLYFATKDDANNHIQNREVFVRSGMQELKDGDSDAYEEILRSVQILYVDAVVGIHKIMVQRDAMNHGTNTLPPVLPKTLLNFSRAQFGDLIVTQTLRLLESFTEHQLLDLEYKFKVFKAQVNQEPNFREMIEAMDSYISFDEAWSTIRLRYPLLCTFLVNLQVFFQALVLWSRIFLSYDMKKTIIGHH